MVILPANITHIYKWIIRLLFLLTGQASARGLLEASIPAPAPAPINTTPPIADLLFTLSAAKVSAANILPLVQERLQSCPA